jgi:hypothetical protein
MSQHILVFYRQICEAEYNRVVLWAKAETLHSLDTRQEYQSPITIVGMQPTSQEMCYVYIHTYTDKSTSYLAYRTTLEPLLTY